MDLKQEKESRGVPYPTAVLTVVAGAFFLLGTGISAYTLNAVEASSSTAQHRLNIAKLAESRQTVKGLATDVALYEVDGVDGTVSLEYPSGWSEADLDDWNTVYEDEDSMFYVSLKQEGDTTSLETATKYAALIGEDLTADDITLVDSGETDGEALVYGLYGFEFEEDVYTMAVIDLAEVEGKGEVRLVLVTNESAGVLTTLLNTVNITANQ